ncbi:MAG: hypothetical protein EZS28_051664, partial [Streblomastix strix]
MLEKEELKRREFYKGNQIKLLQDQWDKAKEDHQKQISENSEQFKERIKQIENQVQKKKEKEIDDIQEKVKQLENQLDESKLKSEEYQKQIKQLKEMKEEEQKEDLKNAMNLEIKFDTLKRKEKLNKEKLDDKKDEESKIKTKEQTNKQDKNKAILDGEVELPENIVLQKKLDNMKELQIQYVSEVEQMQSINQQKEKDKEIALKQEIDVLEKKYKEKEKEL